MYSGPFRLARKDSYGGKPLLYVGVICSVFSGVCAVKVSLQGFSEEYVREQMKNKKHRQDPFANSPLMLLSKAERDEEVNKIKEQRRQSNLCNFIVKNIRESRKDGDPRLERASAKVQLFEYRKAEVLQKKLEMISEHKQRIDFEVDKLALRKRMKGLLTDALNEKKRLEEFSKQWFKIFCMFQVLGTVQSDFKAAKDQVYHSIRASAMLKLYILSHQSSITKDGEDYDTRVLTTAGRGCLLVAKLNEENTHQKARIALGTFFHTMKHKTSLLRRIDRFGSVSSHITNLQLSKRRKR